MDEYQVRSAPHAVKMAGEALLEFSNEEFWVEQCFPFREVSSKRKRWRQIGKHHKINLKYPAEMGWGSPETGMPEMPVWWSMLFSDEILKSYPHCRHLLPQPCCVFLPAVLQGTIFLIPFCSLLYSGFCRTQSLSRHEINMLGPDMRCPAVVSESTFNRHKWTSQFMNKIYVIYPHSVMNSIIPLTGVYAIYTCINIQSLYNDDIT